MESMTYQDYSSSIEYSDEDGCFVGRIVGIGDIVTFHGSTVAELREEFQKAVDHYRHSRGGGNPG